MASVDELWLVDFGEAFPGEPAHCRPAVVVGPPTRRFSEHVPFVILCSLTTRYRDLPYHVEVEATIDNGLAETSYVQCELVRAISRRRLVHRLGLIEPPVSADVHWVLGALLDF